MRRTRRRRSTSSWVSPGPRVPMPPACWESPPPRPRSRGRRYRNSASSTWALPSGLRAFWAKISRITAVRSMAVRPNTFSRFRCWAGLSSSSKTTVSASTDRLNSAISSALPRPTKVAGSGASRRWTTRATTSAPALSTSWASSSMASSTASRVLPGKATPTRMMRSRNDRSINVPGNMSVKTASPGEARYRPPCAPDRPVRRGPQPPPRGRA